MNTLPGIICAIRRASPLVFACVLLNLIGCTQAGPEDQLRATIDRMEEAAEAGEVGTFMHFVAEDFVGDSASMGRAELRRMLLLQLRKSARVSALVSNVEVQIQEDRASASMVMLLTGGPRGWLPDRGQLYTVTTGWRREAGDWSLIQAQWEPQL